MAKVAKRMSVEELMGALNNNAPSRKAKEEELTISASVNPNGFTGEAARLKDETKDGEMLFQSKISGRVVKGQFSEDLVNEMEQILLEDLLVLAKPCEKRDLAEMLIKEFANLERVAVKMLKMGINGDAKGILEVMCKPLLIGAERITQEILYDHMRDRTPS